MPTASRTPKSLIIGTAESWRARKPATAATMAIVRGGAIRAITVSTARFGRRAGAELLLEPVVGLHREVHAQAEQDRQTRDRDHRERHAQVAQRAEGPDQPEDDDAEGQQAPAGPEHQPEQGQHDEGGQRAEGRHPGLQVVVDLLAGGPASPWRRPRSRGSGGRRRWSAPRRRARPARRSRCCPAAARPSRRGRCRGSCPASAASDAAVGLGQEEVDEGWVV